MYVFGVILVRISRIWTEYGEILRISLYSVWMRENADQNNAEYGHFLRSDRWLLCANLTAFYLQYYQVVLPRTVLLEEDQLMTY